MGLPTHRTAYRLIRYVSCSGKGENELVWNSRDGGVPEQIELRSGVTGYRDRAYAEPQLQDYRPPLGARMFVDMPADVAREAATTLADAYWPTPHEASRVDMITRFGFLSGLEHVLHEDLLASDEPLLVEVTVYTVADRVGFRPVVHELMIDGFARCGYKEPGMKTVAWPDAATQVTCEMCLGVRQRMEDEREEMGA